MDDEQKPRQPFLETFKHGAFMDELKGERFFHPTDIPEFFRQHNSFELRKILIDRFSGTSNDFQIYSNAQAEWEELIIFLKKEYKGRYSGGYYNGGNLFLDVLSAYVFKADDLLMLPALRFAISQLESESGVLATNDDKIIKIICGCINNREFNFSVNTLNLEMNELAKKWMIEGLFGILPEIIPVFQSMLNAIYNCFDLRRKPEKPRITYGESDFIQVRRAIDIIIRERHYNTDFLPAIEKMAILHEEKLQLSHSSLKPESIKDFDGNNLLFYPTNQAILDETVRLLRQAQKDNIKNGAARRQEILDLTNR